MPQRKKTKIVSSIGPATATEEKLFELYKAGVNVVRINFSHASYEEAMITINLVKKLNKEGKTKLAMLGDLKGPEIRLGDYEGKKSYKKGDIFKIFVTQDDAMGEQDQFCDYPYLAEDVPVGHILKIESGIFDVLVKEKTQSYLVVEAMNDTEIKQRRHVNLPGIPIRLPGLIEQDKENVLFCIKEGFDFIAMSFVRSGNHVKELRAVLNENGGSHINIVSKVENQEGLDNIEEIVEESDGVMVARGDLGIEIDISLIPVRQRKIVKLCRQKGRFVIVATQLIESMMESPFPTRAEVSDIFNAVVQKTDAIMTSGETTVGKYPVQAIEMMKKIALQAEETIDYTRHDDFENINCSQSDIDKKHLIKAAIEIAEKGDISTIVVFTRSGKLAKMAATYRPSMNIYAFTNDEKTFTSSAILFGIVSRYLPYEDHKEALEEALKKMVDMGDVTMLDRVVVVTDFKKGDVEIPSLEIVTIQDIVG